MANADDADGSAAVGAAFLLADLAAPPHSVSVSAAGGVGALLGAMRHEESELTVALAAALSRLADVPAACSQILAAGVAPCVELLHDARDEVVSDALHVLTRLAVAPEGAAALRAAEPSAPLVYLMEGDSSDAQHGAVNLLRLLTASDAPTCRALVEAGGVAALVPLLFARRPQTAQAALGVLAAIADELSQVEALGKTRTPSCIATISAYAS